MEVRDELDTELWSDFVREHLQGNVFQTPEMAEVYRRARGYEPVFLCLFDGGELKALLLASLISESHFLSWLSTRSIIAGGPLAEPGVSGSALQFLLDAYEDVVSKRAVYTQVRSMQSSGIEALFASSGYRGEERLNFLIDLDRSPEELWRSIPKARRKNIRRAEKLGVTVEEVKSSSLLPVFHRLVRDTYRRVRLPVADISLFQAAFEVLRPRAMARFYLAWHGDVAVASRVVLTYNGVVYDWYAGTSSAHMKLYANEAIVWRVLQDAGEEGQRLFDFGGAGRPGENAGRYHFKKRFGGREVRTMRYEKVHQTWKMKVARAGYGVYKRIKI